MARMQMVYQRVEQRSCQVEGQYFKRGYIHESTNLTAVDCEWVKSINLTDNIIRKTARDNGTVISF